MYRRTKKAYTPGFIEGMLTDVTQSLAGDPAFRKAYSNPEIGEIFKVDPKEKGRGVYLDIKGILKHIGDKRKSEVSVTPAEKRDITVSRQYLKELGLPSPDKLYAGATDKIEMKPVRFSSLYGYKDTEAVYGFYQPGTDYIRISRIIEDNFKQSLGIATLAKKIGENKIVIPKEREESVKRILYGAYLSSGFVPHDDINTFYKKIREDKDFRSRYIKAMLYPAYFIALHEGIHKNTLDPKNYKQPYGQALLYKHQESPYFGLYLMHFSGELPVHTMRNFMSVLSYTFNTAEIDAQLSALKRWYQIQTGKKISTIKDARDAMEYIANLIRNNEKVAEIVPSDVLNQFYAYFINIRMLDFMEPRPSRKEKGSMVNQTYEDIKNSLTTYLYRLAQL